MASSSSMPGLVVALDINGTIIDGDSLSYDEAEREASTSLTEPARHLIADIAKRISVDKQNIQVVVYTLGVDWPGVVKQIEDISGGVISFDRNTSAFYVGRAAGVNPPAVFVRELAEDKLDEEEKPFEHDGIVYNGPNPEWKDPGPALSYEELKERTAGRHLILRAVYNSSNPLVQGREDNKLPAKLIVSELPVIVFDDHPQDWEVVSSQKRIVGAVSPANVDDENPATDFCKELKQFFNKCCNK